MSWCVFGWLNGRLYFCLCLVCSELLRCCVRELKIGLSRRLNEFISTRSKVTRKSRRWTFRGELNGDWRALYVCQSMLISCKCLRDDEIAVMIHTERKIKNLLHFSIDFLFSLFERFFLFCDNYKRLNNEDCIEKWWRKWFTKWEILISLSCIHSFLITWYCDNFKCKRENNRNGK